MDEGGPKGVAHKQCSKRRSPRGKPEEAKAGSKAGEDPLWAADDSSQVGRKGADDKRGLMSKGGKEEPRGGGEIVGGSKARREAKNRVKKLAERVPQEVKKRK